jgi:MFS superfamily sulfate permease-like transporter
VGVLKGTRATDSSPCCLPAPVLCFSMVVWQAYPLGGSFARTAVSADSGTRSLISNLCVGLAVLIVLAALSKIFFYVPMAVLAAIILAAITNLVKLDDFKEAWRLGQRGDLGVMIATFLTTVIFGAIQGIALGTRPRGGTLSPACRLRIHIGV